MRRLFSFFALLIVTAVSIAAEVRGDVTGDGIVDVEDVNVSINVILHLPQEGIESSAADVTGDGIVDVEDVNEIINIILHLSSQPDPEPEKTGVEYVWDMEALPEIHISVSVDEWNRLLSLYDGNHGTKQYVTAQHFTFIQNGEHTEIDSIGLRLKGNTSRRRPEGQAGQMHDPVNPQLRHVHFGINLRKYVKDEAHTVKGVRKLHLKWFKDDAAYVREVFCYNLFRQAGVWTASRDNYCRLWVRIGEETEKYYGVYEMIEPIDENYLKQRADTTMFSSSQGNLWKCKYVGQPATLAQGYNGDYWYDDDTDANHTYTLHTNTKRFENAKAQLIDFQLKLQGKGRESFYQWIQEVCDVDLLLRTYAVNVAVGMWDDYWNNANNYYLYFNTEDIYTYQIYFLPYDYDNTLGTSHYVGNQTDSGRQNPLEWGVQSNRLIQRLMDYDDFRAKYIAYLKEIVADQSDLMYCTDAIERIEAWQNKIRDYVSNDLGEDMVIEDRPAGWGNHPEYRLMELGNDNFFQTKAASINVLP